MAMLGSQPIETQKALGSAEWCGNQLDNYQIPELHFGIGREWSIAKHGYVALNTDWFSHRSAGHLASGSPVVVLSRRMASTF